MNKGAFTLIVWIACVAYCFLPDIAPGPLDDAIVCAATFGLTSIMGGGNNGNNGNNSNNGNNYNNQNRLNG